VKTSGLILIPETEYGVPSGNYDGNSMTFYGDQQKAVGYYKSSSSTQSVRFDVDDFVGTIVIQGTLDSNPENHDAWFELYEFPDNNVIPDDSSSMDSSSMDSSSDGSTAITTVRSVTVTGNFTYIRAAVHYYAGGDINSVTLTY